MRQRVKMVQTINEQFGISFGHSRAVLVSNIGRDIATVTVTLPPSGMLGPSFRDIFNRPMTADSSFVECVPQCEHFFSILNKGESGQGDIALESTVGAIKPNRHRRVPS